LELTIKIKDNPLEKQEIIFENNKNKALMTKADSNDSAENIISTLQLRLSKPKLIILIFGGESGNLILLILQLQYFIKSSMMFCSMLLIMMQ
jgi:hypothetical protein